MLQSASLNPADVQGFARTAGNISAGENVSASHTYHAWRPGYERDSSTMQYYTGLNEVTPPALKIEDEVIIASDRAKTSYSSVHTGKQPKTFIPREQKAAGHWLVNYVNDSQYDYCVRQPDGPARSTTHDVFRPPASRTSHPRYVTPKFTSKTDGERVPFTGLSETKQQFRRKVGVHSFETPISRANNPPARRVSQMPRAQNRSLSNLSPHVTVPIKTVPTTARTHTWLLKEPEQVRACNHASIEKHFDRDAWAVPGRYRTSYQTLCQEPYTGDALKFPAIYN